MAFTLTGSVIASYERPYTDKQGQQKKAWDVVILHDNSQYQKKVVVAVFDESVWNAIAFHSGNGTPIIVHCDVDAREYNGRWFNAIKCYRAEPAQQQQAPMGGYQQQPMQQGYNPQAQMQGYQQPPMQQPAFTAPVAPQRMPYQPAQSYPSAGGQVQGQGYPNNDQPPF